VKVRTTFAPSSRMSAKSRSIKASGGNGKPCFACANGPYETERMYIFWAPTKKNLPPTVGRTSPIGGAGSRSGMGRSMASSMIEGRTAKKDEAAKPHKRVTARKDTWLV